MSAFRERFERAGAAAVPGESPGAGGFSGPEAGDETARSLVRELVEAAGSHVMGIVLFGSRLAGTNPGAHSAYDFVVVVDAYAGFYRHLVEAGHHARSPRLLASLARILPPNIIAFVPDLPDEPVAKCIVLSGQDFERALSPSSRDHFLKGRMAQSLAVLHARDRRTRQWLERILADARRDVIRWVAPHLDGAFTAAGLARRMLQVSYRGEIRPERADRVDEVFEVQREALESIYEEVLREEARRGTVVQEGDARYRLADAPTAGDRFRNRLYFARSKARATMRWLKYLFTYADWLEYIRRKLERRTGQTVELTERERKYPFVFLWPRFFRILRSLPGAGGAGDAVRGSEPTEESEEAEP